MARIEEVEPDLIGYFWMYPKPFNPDSYTIAEGNFQHCRIGDNAFSVRMIEINNLLPGNFISPGDQVKVALKFLAMRNAKKQLLLDQDRIERGDKIPLFEGKHETGLFLVEQSHLLD